MEDKKYYQVTLFFKKEELENLKKLKGLQGCSWKHIFSLGAEELIAKLLKSGYKI